MPKPPGKEWAAEEPEQAFKADPPILGHDKIVVTVHARDRMKERGVTREEVFEVLRAPDETVPSGRPDRERLRRNKTARVAIDVVFERHPTCLLIITVVAKERRLVRRRRR